MSRKPTPSFLADGVLLVDKPVGPSSHQVLARLKRCFSPAKLGHTGTLDPFASGLLLVLVNRATRLSEFLGAGEKLYQATLALGRATDTGDLTGRTVAEAPVPPLTPARVAEALAELVGERMQAPPAYSAAKHQGRPLYAYARQGEPVAKPPRPIRVREAGLLALEGERVEFRVACSRGTYVRSLGEDLARQLGSEGHLAALRRLGSAPFGVAEALGLEEALALSPAELAARLMPPAVALVRAGLPAAVLPQEPIRRLRQGQALEGELLAARLPAEAREAGRFLVLSPGGDLVAVLAWLEPGRRRPGRDYEALRVFPDPGAGEGGNEEFRAAAALDHTPGTPPGATTDMHRQFEELASVSKEG